MTYSKHDRVTVNTPEGPRTLTITHVMGNDCYKAVTGNGQQLLLAGAMIRGLA